MELADIWLKMAKNESLTPQELDFLRIQGKSTQQNNAQTAGWVNADGKNQFNTPYIKSPIWDNALHSTVFDLTKSLSSSSLSQLNVSSAKMRTSSKVFEIGTTGTRVKVATRNNFLICGYVSFQSNSTGYRLLRLTGRDKDSASLSVILAVQNAVNGETTNIPYSYIYDRVRLDTYNNFFTEEIEMFAYQNSGSALDVTGQICFMEV